MVARLLGSYPSLNLADPKTFAAELVMTLMGFSIRAAELGVARAMTESPQFLPSVPAVRLACEGSRLGAAGPDWERRTQAQLAERAAIEARNSDESAEHRRAVIERLWPRALEGAGPKREIKDDLGFRRFSDEELKSIYGGPEGAGGR